MQLTKLQEELEIVKRECESHARSEDRLKEELVKESQVRATVEAEWNAKADQHKCETELLQEQLQKSEEILESLRSCYTANYKVICSLQAKLCLFIFLLPPLYLHDCLLPDFFATISGH